MAASDFWSYEECIRSNRLSHDYHNIIFTQPHHSDVSSSTTCHLSLQPRDKVTSLETFRAILESGSQNLLSQDMPPKHQTSHLSEEIQETYLWSAVKFASIKLISMKYIILMKRSENVNGKGSICMAVANLVMQYYAITWKWKGLTTEFEPIDIHIHLNFTITQYPFLDWRFIASLETAARDAMLLLG